MADTDIVPETDKPEGLKNEATPSVPVVDTASQAEVERLRKQSEQDKMRINQLENEKADRQKAEDEAQRKHLEDNAEYKTLWEQSEADKQRLADEREADKNAAQLTKVQSEVLADYSKEVVEIAETTGLTLTEDSEAGRKVLKDKLDAIASKVKPVKSNGNNGYTPPAGAPAQEEILTKMRIGDAPTAKAATREYIGGLKAIKRMKQDAGILVED